STSAEGRPLPQLASRASSSHQTVGAAPPSRHELVPASYKAAGVATVAGEEG
ncbi:hypothetical protein PanWU01x14_175300, partial [Parasponia andersonii]